MSLIYKFKKEKVNGRYILRPKIFIVLSGKNMSIRVVSLIDSGSDVTVIPYGIAEAIGLQMDGERDKLYAFREYSEIINSSASITFLGRVDRQSIKMNNVPVLITLPREGIVEEEDVILGLSGIFDAFDITFKKSKNKIILKKSNLTSNDILRK